MPPSIIYRRKRRSRADRRVRGEISRQLVEEMAAFLRLPQIPPDLQSGPQNQAANLTNTMLHLSQAESETSYLTNYYYINYYHYYLTSQNFEVFNKITRNNNKC